MKIIQLILCSLLLVHCQNSKNSSFTTFNIHTNSEAFKNLKISKYNFNQDTMVELKLSTLFTENAVQTIQFPFEESAIYAFEFGSKKETKIAVEKSGIITIELGDTISLDSNIAKISDFEGQIQKLNLKHFAGMIEKFDKAIKENDQATIIELEKKKDVVLSAFTKEMEGLVKKMGPSALAFDALPYFDMNKNFNFIQEMYDQFQTEFPQSEMTKSLERRIKMATRVSIGKKAPEFKAQNMVGSDLKLEDFSGRYLLIDFWASWCRPCRVENPKIVDIYKNFKNQGFDVLHISIDKDQTTWEQAINKDGLFNHQQILDSDLIIYKLFSLSTLPSNFLLDKKGTIIAKNINAEDLEVQLNTVFSNLNANKNPND